MSAQLRAGTDANEESCRNWKDSIKRSLLQYQCGTSFTESLAQCAGMKKLTATVLIRIEKIEVTNPIMVTGEETEVDFLLQFVGSID